MTDAAIALAVIAGEDPRDARTSGAAAKAQGGPYTKYLKTNALEGKRFGVPAFFVQTAAERSRTLPLEPEARAMFMRALDELRKSGATIVIDLTLLPESFLTLVYSISTQPFAREGLDNFLRDFGPEQFRTVDDYQKAVGRPLPAFLTGGRSARPHKLATDPDALTNFWGPQKKALAAYEDAFTKFRLDGLIYPAAQMPPNDETIPGQHSSGPHSETGWINPLGAPAIVVPAGFYPTGLPFGIEFAARPWKDGDLLGWAFAFEQATKHRRAPTLFENQDQDRPQAPAQPKPAPAAGVGSRALELRRAS